MIKRPNIKYCRDLRKGRLKELCEKRTEFLNSKGIRVLRFLNIEVLGNLEKVYTVIEDEIEKISPQPGLLPRGEKE